MVFTTVCQTALSQQCKPHETCISSPSLQFQLHRKLYVYEQWQDGDAPSHTRTFDQFLLHFSSWDARATRTGYWPSYLAVTCISVNRVSSSDGRLYDWTESTLLIFMNMQRTRSPSTLNWLEPTRPTDSDTSPAPTRLTGDPVSW